MLMAIMAWKVAILIALSCILCSYYQSDFHVLLVSLGQTFPILQTIGELFHESKSNVKSVPPTKGAQKDVHDWMKGPKRSPDLKLLTDDDIKYEKGGKLLLVIIGHVFDVSQGENYYKPDSGYFGFIGQDASRAFVTGQFDKEGLISDLSGLATSDYKGLAEWLKFYLDHGQYVHVGYHIGRYFDENGKETADMKELKGWVTKAQKEEDDENDLKKMFPPCNVEWSSEKGTTFTCTTLSGGISRDWTGVPRQFFQEGSATARCACVHPNYLADPRIKAYDNCDAKSLACKLP